MDPKFISPNRYASGGIALSDATKGIRTKEGMDMAKNKFQLDRSKADKDGDGDVSEMEKVSGEAAQRTVGKDDIPAMAHGGLMCGEGEDELPIGANPENVADDIPAMLSQDEYVLPAHVVKWHGLKHIQEMQAEAEAGLMAMSMAGLIGGEEPEEENEPEEGSEEDVAEDLAEGEALDEDDMIESENVEVESPTVMVEDELEDESYEEEPSSSALPGMMKKQRYAFIIS